MKNVLRIICLSLFLSAYAWAAPYVPSTSSDFIVPPPLRPRVEFWIDIFTKYGKDQVVLHHREFPQIVFGDLDFSEEAANMSAIQLEKYKKRVVAKNISDIKSALLSLSRGNFPESALEKRIVREMSFLPGGISKYQRAVKEDLVRSQTGIKERFREAVQRAGRYLPVMERIFVENDLPIELTRLPYVESSFNYNANSSVGAAGIWQFMPKTGRLYMRVNSVVDERRDPVEATKAAARYLRQAYQSLGEWPLALTSYNHGVAGVMRAVRKFGTKDIVQLVENPKEQAFGFASNNFYAEFLAALEVHRNYHLYFPDLQQDSELRFEQVRLDRPTSVNMSLAYLGLEESVLRELNIGLSSNVWKGRIPIPAGYVLKVPAGYGFKAARLNSSKEVILPKVNTPAVSSVYGGITYKVRPGDSLISIARKYNISVDQLKSANGLKSHDLTAGTLLKIKRNETNAPREISNSKKTPAKTRNSSYKIRSGDTLSGIAKKFGMTLTRLRELNHVKDSSLKVGKILTVEVPR